MSRIAAAIGDLVGNTPLFEPVRVEERLGIRAHLLCKLEGQNPAGSSKDRAALSMLRAAEEAGMIHPGDTLVEQTSGNTGIALAAMAVPKGYRCDIFLEAGVTRERKKILLALGCRLRSRGDIPGISKEEVLAHPYEEASLAEIRAYCKAMGPRYHFLDQTTNPNNPLAHVRTTGPEIWRDTDGKVDALVLMAGTGGTLRGLSQYLREKNSKIRIIAAEPAPCSRRCEKNPNCQIIDGVLDFDDHPDHTASYFITHDLYDRCLEVSAKEADETARLVARTEGLLFGTSGAAALSAAIRLAKDPAYDGKNLVVIIPDGGGKYLSSPLYGI